MMENAAVIAEFTAASFQLNSWDASWGTDDKIPRNKELIQMMAGEIFIFCCCMETVRF